MAATATIVTAPNRSPIVNTTAIQRAARMCARYWPRTARRTRPRARSSRP